jgi:hypothetical protein
MPKIQKLIAVREIEKPCPDSFKTNVGAAGSEIRADAWQSAVGFRVGRVLTIVVSSQAVLLDGFSPLVLKNT